jgi:glutamine synthetase
VDVEAISRVVEQANDAGAELIRFLYVDHGGVVRGKATSRSTLARRMASGIGLTVAMQAMNMLDELQPVDGMGPVGEVRIVPDPDSYVNLPFSPGAAAMMSDLIGLDGRPWAACPRSFLRSAITEAARDGLVLQAAFEPEFLLARRETGPDGDRLVPVDESLCFSTTGFALAHDFAIDFVRAIQAQGMAVELYHPELGHGQQELSIRHTPALAAADRQVWYRETARGVAWRHGLWASLAPKPLPDQAGNGAHCHFSAWTAAADSDPGAAGPADAGYTGSPDDGDPADRVEGVSMARRVISDVPRPNERNVFYDAGDRYGLSQLAYHFIGGILQHLPALVALTCGSVNSYRRLQPQHWSSAFVCYGNDNREAAIRIPSRMWGDDEGSANLELKASDSTGNPYLALGALIHAGLDGIRRKLDPGEPVNVDPATLSEKERRSRGVARLPTSLAVALDELERDELLMEALGPLRRTAYLAVKRSEIASFAAHDAAYECLQHALRF